MHPIIAQAVRIALEGRRFTKSLDGGCGTGDGGEILQRCTSYLIGVDVDPNALKVAESRGFYDELLRGDIRTFKVPWDVDSVFLFDVVEHFPKRDGLKLLREISNRFVMITTPWWSLSLLSLWSWDGHVCTWTAEDLRAEGFTTAGYSFFPDVFMCAAYGGIILAWRP